MKLDDPELSQALRTGRRRLRRARTPASEGNGAPDQLHVCFHCSGELVYPLDWSEEGPRHWRIVLRCPECESRREGVFDQAAVERLDDELDRGSSALLGDLRRMTHANMSEEIEFFVRALEADLITPERLLAARRDSGWRLIDSARRRAPAASPSSAPASREQTVGSAALASATTASARSRASSSAPVAAIRSHSASACSGPLQRAQVDRGQLRLALAGEDQRQRDGAVEQVGAPRLARALDRPGDVEHVVEQLEGEADAAGERAERVGQRRPSRRAAVSAPSRQAASNRAAVFSSQRRR